MLMGEEKLFWVLYTSPLAVAAFLIILGAIVKRGSDDA